MSRKDTIIVAALINTGLLAVLFMMAIHTETLETMHDLNTGQEIVEAAPIPIPPAPATPEPTPIPIVEPPQPTEVALADVSNKDEFDQVLGRYAPTSPPPVVTTTRVAKPEPVRTQVANTASEDKYVEVTVKRGDYLEKIANANGTTVSAIMRANNLPSVRINVGQVLRIPLGDKTAAAKKPALASAAKKPPPVDADRRYYTMQSGDNPWKIAKEYHVRFDELLKMNDLDEAKARNLRPGDVLRVK